MHERTGRIAPAIQTPVTTNIPSPAGDYGFEKLSAQDYVRGQFSTSKRLWGKVPWIAKAIEALESLVASTCILHLPF